MKVLDFFKQFPWNPQVKKPSTLPLLKMGSTDKFYIEILHKQLLLKGASAKKLSNDIASDSFEADTLSEVLRFQTTHLGPDNEILDADGKVGSETWWALFDESNQKLNLSPKSSEILSKDRLAILNVAEAEHAKGAREIPTGSNWGGEVSKYLKFVNIGPNPWCLAFCQWVTFEALKNLPWKNKGALVSAFWALCKKLGFAFTIKEYSPIPGDFFVIINKNGTGHIGIVTNVNSATTATQFNAIEGNSSDRVAKRLRNVGSNNHIGYINMYGDSKNRPNFSVGLVDKVDNSGLSQTR